MGHVHRLSDDVLGEIFMTVRELFDSVPSESYANGRNPHSTWTLSLVCSRWNHVARGYPLLWAKIVIILKPHIDDIVKLYIERSQDAPLTLLVGNVPGIPTKVAWDARELLFDVLWKSRSRWRSFDISDPPHAFNSTYLYRLFSYGYRLERLESLISPTFNVLSRCRGLQDAPRLRMLHISDLNIAPDGELDFPFQQIRTLRVTTRDTLSVGLGHGAALLSVGATMVHFPALKEIQVTPHSSAPRIVPGRFDTITTFTLLLNEDHGSCWTHFDGLVFPALVELNVKWVHAHSVAHDGGYLSGSWLQRFLAQTSQPLRVLRIENMCYENASYLPFGNSTEALRQMAGLTHLSIRDPFEDNILTNSLIPAMGQAEFMPLLEGVEFVWTTAAAEFDEMGVVKMLETRGFGHSTVGHVVPHNLESRKAKARYITLIRDGMAEFHYP